MTGSFFASHLWRLEVGVAIANYLFTRLQHQIVSARCCVALSSKVASSLAMTSD
jgi:hypothetical protein